MKIMKKVAIMLSSVFFINAVGVHAATSTAKSVPKEVTPERLLLSKAVIMANDSDTTIKQLRGNLLNMEESRDKAVRDMRNASTTVEMIGYNETMMSYQINKDTVNYQIEVKQAANEYNALRLFVDIVKSEEALVMYDKTLELEEKNFKITEVRRDLGLISESDYQNAETSLEKTKATRKDRLEDINKAYRELNRLIGAKDLTQRYELVFDEDIKLKKIGDFDLSQHIKTAILSDQTIKNNEANIKLEQYRQDNHLVKNINQMTYEILDSATTHDTYSRNMAQYARDTEDRKKTIDDKLTDNYNSIITIEREYEKSKVELGNMKKQLEIKRVQLELGKITPIEFETYEYQIENLEYSMQNMIYSHYTTVYLLMNYKAALA